MLGTRGDEENKQRSCYEVCAKEDLTLAYFGGSLVLVAVVSVGRRRGGPGSGGRLCLPFAEAQTGGLAEAMRAYSTNCLAASHPTLSRFAIFLSQGPFNHRPINPHGPWYAWHYNYPARD
jgi:hypothetical protein